MDHLRGTACRDNLFFYEPRFYGDMELLVARLEEFGETVLTKKSRKRFLSTAGPVLLVLTFVEDGMLLWALAQLAMCVCAHQHKDHCRGSGLL